MKKCLRFGQNQLLRAKEMNDGETLFWSFLFIFQSAAVTLKKGQCHQNLILLMLS